MRRWYWIGILVPALLASMLWQQRGRIVLDIGSPNDEVVLTGFHDRESSAIEHGTYRWSSTDATVTFASYRFPGLLQMRSRVVPDGTHVTLVLNDDRQITLPALTHPEPSRIYSIYWDGAPSTLGQGVLHITARQSDQPLEIRPLGLLIDKITVASIGNGLTMPPWLLVGGFSLMTALLVSGLRFFQIRPSYAMIVSVLLGSSVVILWAVNPHNVQPLVPGILIGLGSISGLLWWVQRIMAMDTVPHQGRFLLALGAGAGILPTYTAYRYGFTLWFHWLPVVLMVLCVTTSIVPKRTFPWMLGLISGVVIIYGVASYHNVFARDYADDFTALFRGPRAFLSGGELYNLEAITTNHLGNSFKYPPLFVLIMGPLTSLDYVSAIQLWRGINLVLLAGAGTLLWLASGAPLRSWTTLALGLMVLIMQPLRDTLRYGQVDAIMLVCIAGAYLALQRQRWSWWGICLAVPIAVKVYPVLLLLHGGVMRRWRGLMAALLTLIMLGGSAVAILGWTVHATYLIDVLPAVGGGTPWVENQTLNGWMNRLIATTISLTGDQSAQIRLWTIAGALVVGTMTLLRSRRCTPTAGLCLWIITMLIILPISWIHYHVLLIVPLFHLFWTVDRHPDTMSPRWSSIYVVAWMLLVLGNQWTFFNRVWYGPVWALILSYKLYGLILLWCAFAFDPRFQTVPHPSAAHMRSFLIRMSS